MDVCNWMGASGVGRWVGEWVGGWVGEWVGEFLRHNATNSLLIFCNVTW